MYAALDLAILHWIQNTMSCPFLDALMPFMSAIGDHGIVWIAVAVALLFAKRYRKWGIFMLASVFVAWVFGEQVMKVLVARPRPFLVDPSLRLIVDPPSGYSMPSGHTLTAFCAATVLMFSPLRKGEKAGVWAVAALIAFSRLYLCVHNPSDVAVGALFGVAFGLVGGHLCERWSLDLGALWRYGGSRRPAGKALPLMTTWGQGIVDDLAFPGRRETFVPLAEHPRPMFARAGVLILNGTWQCAVVADAAASDDWRDADPPAEFDREILVPFPPEAELSGVGHALGPDELLWYRRTFESAELPEGARYILHFEAVDFACAVYVNGTKAALHVGGYLPFEADVTEALVEGENELLVCVQDPGESGPQLRGLQGLGEGAERRPAVSGIWQTVWLEAVPENYIAGAEVRADAARESLTVVPRVHEVGSRFTAVLRDADGRTVGRQSILVSFDRISTPELRMHVPSPHLWSPEDPYLYTLEFSYGRDRVGSYCAFRTVEVREDEEGVERFYLNGEPRFFRGVLDEGYWPDGLMTPPSDEALAYDVQSAKGAGFDLIRLHGKVESARFYWHCDRLGMLVWQDLVGGGDAPDRWRTRMLPRLWRGSWGRYADSTVAHCKKLGSGDEVYRKEWRDDALATVRLLKSRPCIAAWSLFDEGRGQFAAIAALSLVRGADDTRPVDAVGGWFDQGCGDFQSVHSRFRRLEVYRDRKGRDGEGGGLAAPTDRDLQVKRAFALTDFGGLACWVEGHGRYGAPCGRDDLGGVEAWRVAAEELLTEAERLEPLGASGFVFAQLADVEGDTRGVLTYDRRVNKLGTGVEVAAGDGAEEPAGAEPTVGDEGDGDEPESGELADDEDGHEQVPEGDAQPTASSMYGVDGDEGYGGVPMAAPVVLDDAAFEPQTPEPGERTEAAEEVGEADPAEATGDTGEKEAPASDEDEREEGEGA